jgi:hypothetical protein
MIRTRSILTALCVVSLLSTAFSAVIGLIYSYRTASGIESAVGLVILLATTGALWLYRHSAQPASDPALNHLLWLGLILGVLWMVEIGINNLLAPPLPVRDVVDNIFWVVIALAPLTLAILRGYQANSIVRGLEAGACSGLVSGLLACFMALSMILFAMRFITHDPLNIAEWAARRADSQAPTIAAYFAFETLSGALGHLLVLGLGMGAALGVLGGILGKGLRTMHRLHVVIT